MSRSRLPYLLQKATNRPLGAWHGIAALLFQPIRWLARLLPYGHNYVTKEQWEREYAGGRWAYLHQIDQMARYAIITGYYQQFKPGGSVLDVGCGDGILLSKLRPFGYSRYVGIDIAAEAIAQASTWEDDKTIFLVTDVMEYSPTERFDVIALNECLYYFDDPLAVIRRYEPFLAKKGIFIVSLYVTEMNTHVWKMLDGAYATRDGVKIVHNSGNAWKIQVLQPSPDGEDIGLEVQSPLQAETGRQQQAIESVRR